MALLYVLVDQVILQNYCNVTKHHPSNQKQRMPDHFIPLSALLQIELELLSQTIQEPKGSACISPRPNWCPGTVLCMKVKELGALQQGAQGSSLISSPNFV